MNSIETFVSDSAVPGNPKYMPGHDGFTIEMRIFKRLDGKTVQRTPIYTDVCEPQSPYWIVARGEVAPTPTPVPVEWPTFAPATEPAAPPS